MTGNIVNTILVFAGGLIGVLVKKGISEKMQDFIMKLLGLFVALIGLSGILTTMISADPETGKLASEGSILLLVSLVIGGVAGELLRIDDRIQTFCSFIERKVNLKGFGKGFSTASIIFCVGAMAIIGAMEDSLLGKPDILITKGMIDFVCAIVLASTLGIGVMFSGISVFLYQGLIALLATWVAPLISTSLIETVCMVGYVAVMCIGLNFLKLIEIKVANLLPAMLVPVLWRGIQLLYRMIVAG